MSFVWLKLMVLLVGSAGCTCEWDPCTLLKRLIKEYGQIRCLPKWTGLQELNFCPSHPSSRPSAQSLHTGHVLEPFKSLLKS